MADLANKAAATGLSLPAIGTIMTIRERPSTMIGSANDSSALFSAFRRSIGYEIDYDNRMPNCVFANWPAAQQKITGIGVEKINSRIFITVTAISSEKENAQKSVHLQLEQDKSVERRILSIPAHILRWIGLKSGDEVSVQLNNDLSRGYSEGKEELPPTSFSILRVQVKVQLAALREFSKLSLNADSLANCFRQTFLHDVLNVGQNCLLTFECTSAAGIGTQQNERRKRKCVEMREENKAEDDLEPPQLKKGLAASTFSALFGWTGFDRNASTHQQQYTIEAKILALSRPLPGTVNLDAEAQFGLVKEGTQIVFCPVAESGLCLYGDPAIISSSSAVKTNEEDGENKTKDGKKENDKKTAAESVKLIVQQFSDEMKCRWEPKGEDHCLLHNQDYNVVTKKFSEASDSSGSLNTHIQQGSVRRRRGLNQKIYVLITYKVQEGAVETKATENDKKERQIVWTAVNSTNAAARGERGKIFMSHELMEELKIEPGDEVTVQSFDQENKMAQQIKMEIENCDESRKCPAHHWMWGHPKCTSLFHVNDIINTFKRNYSGRIVNLNISSYLKVEDKEVKKAKKSIKSNMFDYDGFESSCLKFRVTEIQAGIEEKKSEETSSNSSTNSSSETTQNGEKSTAEATKTVDKTSSFPAEFATIKKGTIIELKIKTDDKEKESKDKESSKLIIYGIENQANNEEQPSKLLMDEKSWNFSKKIGGLDEQLGEIFRRAFASRMISADCCKEMGLKHVRGILLYGPPGTGKTLIARELAKALNSREPKIINGAEVQSMWLGESEKNVRSLFVDAEREQALAGDKSGLHVIIVDELDALCPNRQLTQSSHRTEQRIVNTLLSKLDGVEQLNNILLIGMTNLMETIDPALLRPGRLELKIHIGLPSEKGRREILDIHTSIMREAKRLHEDVNLDIMAKKTVNFSGAELEGLVRAAQSQAIQRIIKAREQNAKENGSTIGIDPSNDSDLKICSTDFELAFENDIKPAFGKGSMDSAQLNAILCREPILWSPKIEKLLEKGANLVEKLQNSNVSAIGQSCFLLLNGPMQSGKTFLATTIAHRAGIPYIRLITADSMLTSSNMQEKTPTGLLDQIIFDCENTDFACIIFDELEQIIGYNEVNGHGNWRHTILQKLAIIFNRQPKKGKRLLLLATSCEGPEWFEQMQLPFCLQNRNELPGIGKFEDLINFLGAAAATKNGEKNEKTMENGTAEKLFTKSELDLIAKEIGPKLDGGRQMMPTIKDLMELIEWYSTQCNNAKATGDALNTNGQHELTNGEQIQTPMSSHSFSQFKQKLVELIEQKQKSAETNFKAHLSMYR